MKFIIEPINDTDCRIVDIDCSDLQVVKQLTIPATVEQDGKVWQVKEVGDGATFANNKSNPAKVALIGKIKKLIIAEGNERLGRLMGNDGTNPASR